MDVQESSVSGEQNRVFCACKSTCSTKQARNANRGCPCKTEGVMCSSLCKCGSESKPCRNKANESNRPVPSRSARDNNNYSSERDRPIEEAERMKENQDVKDFIQTLDEPMVQKLCVRSLQRGIGSMDYIHGLLIMEDDNDSEHETDDGDDTPLGSGSEQTVIATPPAQDPEPHSSSTAHLPWCKCNQCVIMPLEIENKCCGRRRCVTSYSRFTKLCVDPDVLQLCIINRAGIHNDRDDNSTRDFRKAAYRQYILDRYRYLRKGNRKVCPSCVVKTVRLNYPSQTGVYMGCRPE